MLLYKLSKHILLYILNYYQEKENFLIYVACPQDFNNLSLLCDLKLPISLNLRFKSHKTSPSQISSGQTYS